MPYPQDNPPDGMSWQQALHQSGVLEILADFDPHVAGTLPLGISVPGSDIDILCFAPDAIAFSQTVWEKLHTNPAFRMHQWTGAGRPIIASFLYSQWPFEIFGADQPVRDQPGWRHFMIENRLLALATPAFRDAIIRERAKGMKTEAAFAKLLHLGGDPYDRLYQLSAASDHILHNLLGIAGHALNDGG